LLQQLRLNPFFVVNLQPVKEFLWRLPQPWLQAAGVAEHEEDLKMVSDCQGVRIVKVLA
jgi:hypothetical protein